MVVVSVRGALIARDALREFSLKGQSRAYLSAVCRTSDKRPMRGIQCSVPPLHFIRKFSAKICRIRLIGWLAQGTTRACGRDDEYYASWRFRKAALAYAGQNVPRAGDLDRRAARWMASDQRVAGGCRLRAGSDALSQTGFA